MAGERVVMFRMMKKKKSHPMRRRTDDWSYRLVDWFWRAHEAHDRVWR